MPSLTIGRMVLYRRRGFMEVPAVVTRVWAEGLADLTIFKPDSTPSTAAKVPMIDHEADPQAAAKETEMWRWPPRAPDETAPPAQA